MDPQASAADEPSLTIAGDKVALGRLRRELLPLYERWYGDFEVGVTFFRGELVPETAEGAAERYERAVTASGTRASASCRGGSETSCRAGDRAR